MQSPRQLVVEAPAGYEPTIAPWIWALEDTRALTLEELGGLEPPLLDWTPPEGGNSIGTLLYHIAAIEADWLYVDALGQAFPSQIEALLPYDVRDAQGVLTAVRGLTLEQHLARLDAVRAALLEAYRALSLEAFRRPRSLPTYQVTPEWVLHHLVQHEAEHRGHIAMLRERGSQSGSPL
jgi:uncharacterized damage-inducible protein DinB